MNSTIEKKTNIEEILDKYQNAKRDSLILILQEVQGLEGYISKESIKKIGESFSQPIFPSLN